MKNRFLAVVSALSAVALVSGALVVTANAHIGVTHNPFATDAPDLVSVAIDGDDVVYCFDEEVSTQSGTDADFFLQGYDSAVTADSDDQDLSPDDNNCIDTQFDNIDRPLEEFTIGGVLDGAVDDRQDNENIEATAALDGSEQGEAAGDTEAPNLVSFDSDEQDDTVTYGFDQDVEENCPGLVDGNDFGYYNDDGTDGGQFRGLTIIECDGTEIVVQFAADDVNDVSRVFIDPNGTGGPPQSADPSNVFTGFEGIGGDTDSPDLTDVERSDDNQWIYHFDANVENEDFTSFFLYEEDGTEHQADACDATDQEVECDFDDLEDALDGELPLGAVEEGAVDDEEGNNDASTYGSAPAGTSMIEAGASDGPDLETCDLTLGNQIVRFGFDEHTSEDSVATATGFYLIDDNANKDAGDEIDDADDEAGTIDIEFSQAEIDDAIGCGVEVDVIEDENDFLQNENPLAAVGAGSTQSSSAPPSTTTATTTSTSTSTVTTSPPPGKRKVATNVSKPSYSNNRFRGSVNSSVKRCQQRRGMKLKKHTPGKNRTVGSKKSGRSGNYKFLVRNARGRYYVIAAKKKFTNRKGTVIVCRRDKSPTGVVK